MVSFLNGQLYSQVNTNDGYLHQSLGVLIAEITKALADFEDPIAHRKFNWDIAQLELLEVNLDYYQGRKKQLLQKHFQYFMENTKPLLETLPKQVIHNDANDNNLIASIVNDKLRCIGLFDFGDMVYTQRICELAIAMSYALMSQHNYLATARSSYQGSRSHFKVLNQELALLPNLIKARLVQSLLNSGKSYFENPDNDYLLISASPAWDLLKKLDKLQTNEFADYLN
jgi:Ser/Thr protein kinase RdoA (MazF antagonist)